MTETLTLKNKSENDATNEAKIIEELMVLSKGNEKEFNNRFMEAIRNSANSYKITVSLFCLLLQDKNESLAFQVFNRIKDQQTKEATTFFSNNFKEQIVELIEDVGNLEKLRDYLSKNNKSFEGVENREKLYNLVKKRLEKRKKQASKDGTSPKDTVKSSVPTGQDKKTKSTMSFDDVFSFLKKIQSENENLKNENKSYQEKIEKFSSEKSDFSLRIDKLQSDVKDKDNEIKELRKEKAEIERQKKVSEEKSISDIKEKEEQIRKLEKDISETENANEFLKKEKSTEKETFIQNLGECVEVRYKNYMNLKKNESQDIGDLIFIIDALFDILENNGINFKSND